MTNQILFLVLILVSSQTLAEDAKEEAMRMVRRSLSVPYSPPRAERTLASEEKIFFRVANQSHNEAECDGLYKGRKTNGLNVHSGAITNPVFMATLTENQEIRVCLAKRLVANQDSVTAPFQLKEFVYLQNSLREIPGVDGQWGNWAETTCAATCGESFYEKTRCCDSPPKMGNGKDCVGPTVERVPCNLAKCPIDGGWTEWTPYECRTTCGQVEKAFERTRECKNPTPAHGGKQCVGVAKENHPWAKCSPTECAKNGLWQPNWSTWTECTTPCYDGKMTINEKRSRWRHCVQPENGGEACSGAETEVEPCKDVIPRCTECGSDVVSLPAGKHTFVSNKNFPNNYVNNTDCTTKINAKWVQVTMMKDLRPGGNCDSKFIFSDSTGAETKVCKTQLFDNLIFASKKGPVNMRFTATGGESSLGTWQVKVASLVVVDTTAPVSPDCITLQTQSITAPGTDMPVGATWTAPTFTDDSGVAPTVTVFGDTGLAWGIQSVTYTATDAAGNSATCDVSLTINKE